MVERPVLKFTITKEKEYLDPHKLEGYHVGDTVGLIYGPDLEKLVKDLKELLDDYQELYENYEVLYKEYEDSQEVIKKHIEKQGGG